MYECNFYNIAKGAINSAKTGLKAGAVSGASNYTIECAFEEDKEFNIKDLATETATNSLVSGTVGLIVGGTNGGLRSADLLHSGGTPVVDANGNLIHASVRDVMANTGCSAAHKILNSEIKSIKAA